MHCSTNRYSRYLNDEGWQRMLLLHSRPDRLNLETYHLHCVHSQIWWTGSLHYVALSMLLQEVIHFSRDRTYLLYPAYLCQVQSLCVLYGSIHYHRIRYKILTFPCNQIQEPILPNHFYLIFYTSHVSHLSIFILNGVVVLSKTIN